MSEKPSDLFKRVIRDSATSGIYTPPARKKSSRSSLRNLKRITDLLGLTKTEGGNPGSTFGPRSIEMSPEQKFREEYQVPYAPSGNQRMSYEDLQWELKRFEDLRKATDGRGDPHCGHGGHGGH